MVSGVLPVRVLTRILYHNSTGKGEYADRALTATNRPTIRDHWMEFAKYLTQAHQKNEAFIIPPLTLNSTGGLLIYAPEGQESTGYAIFPEETYVHITDGQHRFLGMKKVAEDIRSTPGGDRFMNTGVPFMMTIEADPNQAHQDFADTGRTRALPPSLLAVYDTRQPANAAVISIIEKTPLLRGRVDATSTIVNRSSPFIFLANQVRRFVKYSLTGSTENNSGDQEAEAIGSPESQKSWIDSRVAFLKVMTEIVPDLNEVAELLPPNGTDAAAALQRMKKIRDRQNVPLNGAFLTTLGLVSHTVLQDIPVMDEAETMERLREELKPLRDMDWSRSAPVWNGNIVSGGKIRNQTPAVKAASFKILELLGYASK